MDRSDLVMHLVLGAFVGFLVAVSLGATIGRFTANLRPWLARWELRRLAPHVPDLYAGRSDAELACPMSEAELARLRVLPRLRVHALAVPEGEADLADAALALSRIVIRELTLAPALVVNPSSETPHGPQAEPVVLRTAAEAEAHALGGELVREGTGLRATLRLASSDGQRRERVLRCADARELVREVCEACVTWLGGPTPAAKAALRFELPERLADLCRIGAALRPRDERGTHERDDELLDVLDEVEGSGVAAVALSHHQLERMLEALAAEPEDAELAARIYLALRGEGYEGRTAWQFLRRALDLAPSCAVAQREWPAAVAAPDRAQARALPAGG